MQALEAPPPTDSNPRGEGDNRTGADLIAALQSSPYRDVEIEPARYPMPARDVVF